MDDDVGPVVDEESELKIHLSKKRKRHISSFNFK